MTIVKAVVLGETECGKTSFTSRWTKGIFPDPALLKTTVGASFDTKKVVLPDGREVVLSLWDFGGQLRFIESLKGMVRGAKLGLLFFDVTKLATLDSIFGYWIPLIEENSNLRVRNGDGDRFILVGNKIDLLGGSFDSVEAEMTRLASPYGIETQMISAKTGIGIESLDYKFTRKLEKYSN
ncbi:MAG: GTP-binding protein [Candidatus Thorarchaeota archaeon]|nr:GTP-binding protein [Candidatus Thorarchaeota archaeon]